MPETTTAPAAATRISPQSPGTPALARIFAVYAALEQWAAEGKQQGSEGPPRDDTVASHGQAVAA